MAEVPITIKGTIEEHDDGTVTIVGTASLPQAANPIAPGGPSQGPVPPSSGAPEHPTAPPGPAPHGRK